MKLKRIDFYYWGLGFIVAGIVILLIFFLFLVSILCFLFLFLDFFCVIC